MNAEIQKEKVFVAWLSVASNSTLVVAKLVIGIFIGSVSVISEAIHSGIDLLASLIALVAVRHSSKPADEDHPYGHGKFENVSGTVEALLIFFAAIWIIYEAIQKLLHPHEVGETSWGIGVMLISAIMNTIISSKLFKVAKKANSVALEADAWHLRTDVYTSLGVMGGLLIIWIMGKVNPELNVSWIDPVAAIGVACLILHAAYELTMKAGQDLFDVSLSEDEVQEIKAIILSHNDVVGIHELKTRRAGHYRFVEFHMEVDNDMPVKYADKLAHDVEDKIKASFEYTQVTVHLDPVEPLPRG